MARPGVKDIDPYRINYETAKPIQIQKKTPHTPKERSCLNCERVFKSSWAGNRRCDFCLTNPYRMWSRLGNRG